MRTRTSARASMENASKYRSSMGIQRVSNASHAAAPLRAVTRRRCASGGTVKNALTSRYAPKRGWWLYAPSTMRHAPADTSRGAP